MFTALDPTLAYGRREEMAREVSSGRLESRLRDARGGRSGGRWSLRLVRMLRAPSNVNAEAAADRPCVGGGTGPVGPLTGEI